MSINVKLDLINSGLTDMLLLALRSVFLGRSNISENISFSALQPAERAFFIAQIRASTCERGSDFMLMSASQLSATLIERIEGALYPMTLSYQVTKDQLWSAEGCDALLVERALASEALIKITSDDARVETLAQHLTEAGLGQIEVSAYLNTQPTFNIEAHHPAIRRRLMWLTHSLQVPLPQPTIRLDDRSHHEELIQIHVPQIKGDALVEALQESVVRLRGDDLSVLLQVGRSLCDGQLSVVYDLVSDDRVEATHEPAWFEISYGALSYHEGLCDRLFQEVRRALNALEIEEGRSPIYQRLDSSALDWRGSFEELSSLHESHPPVIHLPVGRYQRDQIFSPDRERPSHWQVEVYAHDEERIQPLLSALEALGFIAPVWVNTRPHSLLAELSYPHDCPDELIERVEELAVSSLGFPQQPDTTPMSLGLCMKARAHSEGRSRVISLLVDLEQLDPARHLERAREMSAPYSLTLKCQALHHARPLGALLEQLSPRSIEVEQGAGDEDSEVARLIYGGADQRFIDYLQHLTELCYPVPCELDRQWEADDLAVWLVLPAHMGERSLSSEGAHTELADWFPVDRGMASISSVKTLIEVTDKELMIAELSLPRPQALDALDLARVPSLSDFSGYCLDQVTCESLYHVAEAAKRAEPCLLEGPTSASKTSVILYLAALLGQPVARLNLSAQTDTGELIGRYAPDGEGWRWRDGLVVEAVSRGWWLILDELNLAEPQVLERLNALLERKPSLTVSERDGRLLGGDAAPIHERFRVFATMNPAEYIGRAELSPAYRDRWLADRIVPKTTERALYEMIAYQLWGERPRVNLFGRRYEGVVLGAEDTAAQRTFGLPSRDAELFASRLAHFHCALARALSADADQLSVGARESSVLSRRSLLATIEYILMERPDEAGEVTGRRLSRALKRAIWRYYVSRLRSKELRALAYNLWQVSGLELDLDQR